MNEHISDNLWNRYREGQLTVTELVQFDAHLQECGACQNRLADDEHVAGSFAALRSDVAGLAEDHLSYEQLAAYVDRQLNATDRTIVETHLQTCTTCALEVEDLREFQPELETPTKTPKPTKPNWLAEWWQTRSWRWAMPLAAAAACVFLAWLGLRGLRPATNSNPPQPELAQNPMTIPSPGETLPATSLIAQINDGGTRITLDQQGNLEGLTTFSPDQQQLVLAALKSGKVALTATPTSLIKRADTLLGDSTEGKSFRLISPVGKLELAQRPQFRWEALPGATSYRVTIFTPDYEMVAQSDSFTGTTWIPPRSLTRNQVYLWQVTATKDGQEIKAPVAPAPEARFKVLDQATADGIAAARNSSLVSGLLYAQAGLYDEAERELKKLAKENPQNVIAKQLLDDLHAQRRAPRL